MNPAGQTGGGFSCPIRLIATIALEPFPGQFGALAVSPGLVVRSRAIADSPSFVGYRTWRLEP